MSKTNKIIVGVLLVAVLLLGIGYAAIQSVTLNINGTATADPSQSNFKVMFTGIPEVSDSTYVTAGITDDTNATISVKGLTATGDKVSATYTIQNVSTDISADLTIATTNSNTEYFTVTSKLAKTSLKAGEATTVTVTVELIKTPITGTENSTIGVQITATPVEPGMEGTTNIPEVTTKTLDLVTTENIGDYIDLGNDVIDGLKGTTGLTTDDWRILYADDNYVYAILADYLPVEQVPVLAGLNTNGTYIVNSNIDSDTLLNGLKNETAWSNFANGITGAKATGTPTVELLMSSYNAKNGTSLVYTDKPTLDSGTLYVPHTSTYESCWGYWLASPCVSNSDDVWIVSYASTIGCSYYNGNILGIRPVVSIPVDTKVDMIDGVWTVLK